MVNMVTGSTLVYLQKKKTIKYDRRVKVRRAIIFESFFQAPQLFGISTTAPHLQLADQPK